MAALFAMRSFGLSQRRVSRLVRVSRTLFSYRPKLNKLNEKIRKRLKELAARYRRFGSWKFHKILRREGFSVNHKRVERISSVLERKEAQEAESRKPGCIAQTGSGQSAVVHGFHP